MVFVDRELARRLDRLDALVGAGCGRALARLRPELGVKVVSIAGGSAIFAGVGSPMTHALGIGLDGPVSTTTFDQIEAVAFESGSPSLLEVSCFADPSVFEHLGKRGYRTVEMGNVLFREVGELPECPLSEGVTLAIAPPEEADVWAETIAEGFLESTSIPPSFLDMGRTIFDCAGSHPFLAKVGDEPAGGGGLFLLDGVGGLVGASVRPKFRNRGLHRALLHARLALAAEAGCDLVTMGALPGSGSHRNAERFGLRVAYTRVTYQRDMPTPD